jgi:hypothetical protein
MEDGNSLKPLLPTFAGKKNSKKQIYVSANRDLKTTDGATTYSVFSDQMWP